MTAPIGCAVIGYGPQHNFGWAHAAWISATPELELRAVCDRDPARAAVAAEEFPGVRAVTDLDDLWRDDRIELVSIVTPHHTHCPLALAALEAGKHVVVEKAFCLNVAEATQMVECAARVGRTLAVHHNRRHDGNFRRIKEVVGSGRLGDVFHIELSAGGWVRPQLGWYNEKATSGGGFYYWGPHAVDWVLALVPSPVVSVDGYFHKRVWHEVSNEDQTRAVLRFANGTVADVCWSTIAAVGGRPLWRILGTRGGLVDTGANATPGYQQMVHGPSGGALTVVTIDDAGHREQQELPYFESDWEQYWQDLADHLLRGAPVPVSGDDGRNVIAVFEAAERSSAKGCTERLA